MQKRTNSYFQYPANIDELDLANMVNLFRSRGEPRKAPPGEYFACCVSRKLLKQGKHWFGLIYSQDSWDEMLTKGSEGFPLTDVELNVLGMVYNNSPQPIQREVVENNCGVISKLGYLIINDLRSFGFLEETEEGLLMITPRGDKALQGIARRIYEKRFLPEMLKINEHLPAPEIEQAKRRESDQPSLF